MSILRKTLEENTIPALIISVLYGLFLYWQDGATPLLDATMFFSGYMVSSLIITKIKSNPDKKKADRNFIIYALSVLTLFLITIILLYSL